jgi:hypothetical protein
MRTKGPIVVYQMGKVGSQSVYHSLRASSLKVPIYHIHLLNHLDEIEESLRRAFRNPQLSLDAVEQGRALRAEIERDPELPWNLISLARDPVSRNISRMFQGLDEIDPEIRSRHEQDRVTVDELVDLLTNRWERNSDSQWFDTQLKDVFGLDVYARPFNTVQGFDTYTEGRFRLVVIRTEDLDRCFERSMSEFLGDHRVKLRTLNTSNEKWYGQLHARFYSSVVLPPKYLDEVYSSKYARHFYSNRELTRFRVRWERGNKNAA